ncbi:hypothetical protein GN316_06160 [Xylophilus sp. Kf1]|nr:hypothetical protein [Xylophilus sp. Kf1]
MNSHQTRQAYTNLVIAQHLLDQAVLDVHMSRQVGTRPVNAGLLAVRQANRQSADMEYRRLCALDARAPGVYQQGELA